MIVTAGQYCARCNSPVMLFFATEEEVLIQADCCLCGETHETLLDDFMKGAPLMCCELQVLPYRWHEGDIIFTILCAHCLLQAPISLDDAMFALEEEADAQAEEYWFH